MIHILHPQLAGFIIRLAVFLAVVVIRYHALRLTVHAATGNARATLQVQEQVEEVLWALVLIVVAPSLISKLAEMGATGLPYLSATGVDRNVSDVQPIVDAAVGILTGFIIPLLLGLCSIGLMALGVGSLVASTTSNMFVKRYMWGGTVVGLTSSTLIAFSPYLLAGLLKLFGLLLANLYVP